MSTIRQDGREQDELPDGWRVERTERGDGVVIRTIYDADGNVVEAVEVVEVTRWVGKGEGDPRRCGPARGSGQRPI